MFNRESIFIYYKEQAVILTRGCKLSEYRDLAGDTNVVGT